MSRKNELRNAGASRVEELVHVSEMPKDQAGHERLYKELLSFLRENTAID